MKRVEISQLALENFKGGTCTLDFPGDVILAGRNGVGKTRAADAWFWLLSGRDSHGLTAQGTGTTFEVKEFVSDGDGIEHGTDHAVSAVIQIETDGGETRTISLSRTMREKWTKKRGSATRQLTGHETEFTVDDRPVNLREFMATVVSIFGDEQQLRLLSLPTFFPDIPTQGERRKILLSLIPEISIPDYVGDMEDAAQRLGLYDSGMDLKAASLRGSAKKLNEQIEKIPVRIDEQKRQIRKGVTADSIQEEIQGARQQLTEIEAQQKALDEGAELLDLRREIIEIGAKIFNARGDLQKAISEHEARKAKVQTNHDRLKRDFDRYAEALTEAEEQRNRKRNALDDFRKQYFALAESIPQVDGECPTCGQNLPAEQMAKARQKAEEARAAQLTAIDSEGRYLAKKVKELEAEIIRLRDSLNTATLQVGPAARELEQMLAEPNPSQSPELLAWLIQEAALKAELASADSATQRAELKTAHDGCQQNLEALRTEARALARISELHDEHKTLGAEFETVQVDLLAVEEIIRRRARALESRLGSLFSQESGISFRLFRNQINGGLEDCCDVLVRGVPMGTNLNTGHVTLAGLELIRVVGDHLGMKLPAWVDHAESITELIPETGTQQLRLHASRNFDVLTILDPDNAEDMKRLEKKEKK